jgi:hypothetical protein
MAVTGRLTTAKLDTATWQRRAADENFLCACPCSERGHQSEQVCNMTIFRGDDYATAIIDGRRVIFCLSCWQELERTRTGG